MAVSAEPQQSAESSKGWSSRWRRNRSAGAGGEEDYKVREVKVRLFSCPPEFFTNPCVDCSSGDIQHLSRLKGFTTPTDVFGTMGKQMSGPFAPCRGHGGQWRGRQRSVSSSGFSENVGTRGIVNKVPRDTVADGLLARRCIKEDKSSHLLSVEGSIDVYKTRM
ncbi:hypothetical protein EYF80_020646 [Liparis tanakae]|uniref:Uncharacterized protein n=1 Tax=Liparis tanakae TaxID=230148 RepID=A0A4Z2HTN6_9TELE|nr:hypothetical protein EYF80_020646 [Liparis tanakae]